MNNADPISQETLRSSQRIEVSLNDSVNNSNNVPGLTYTNYSKLGQLASLCASRNSKHFVQTSKSYSAKYENALPKLASSEIEIGSFLGKGAFSNVFEIKSFPMLDSNGHEDKDQHEPREFLKKHAYRETSGACRYAVKFLRKEIVNDSKIFPMAAMDLALECKILCSVFHPNIIKLRGICSEGEMGFKTRVPQGYFLVLDRLDETLEHRMACWKEGSKLPNNNPRSFKLKKMLSANKVLSRHKTISNDKLKIICDISDAFQYLHSRNIIYRDMKPENFGFDVRGDIKLFDFGLSKEITTCDKAVDGTYKLTECAGTLRYMAPEVVKHETYNLSADVYSFCILLWELLTLKKPFEGFSVEKHCKLVAHGTYRPKISKSFPIPIQTLLEEGWSANLHDRPSFEYIFMIFSKMIPSEDEDETFLGSNNSRRRSTYEMLSESKVRDLTSNTRRLSTFD